MVNKPAGLLSQGDLTGDLDVLTLAKEIIKTRDQKPGNVYLGLVHRLDRPVSGAMVIAKTSKAAGRLSQQFRDRKTKKQYLAVVTGTISEPSGTLCHYLQKDPKTRTTRVVSAAKGGRPAELQYRVIASGAGKSYVEIDLLTGLPHQIRAQLSAIGHPIAGDRKYGAPPIPGVELKPRTVALHSHCIGFTHPTTKAWTEIHAPAPSYWRLAQG